MSNNTRQKIDELKGTAALIISLVYRLRVTPSGRCTLTEDSARRARQAQTYLYQKEHGAWYQ